MQWLEEFRDGIALLCGADGRILQTKRNDAGVALEGVARFQELFTDASQSEAESFLSALRGNQATFGWELELRDGIGSAHFAGGVTGEGLLIIGARAAANVRFFCREFIKMHNEQTNALRSAFKELSLKQRQRETQDHRLYDELSRLNNELVTLQRELTRKNIQLDKLNLIKNHFLGMASHDLRKPVSVAMMYVDFLQGAVSGEPKRWLGQITECCQDVLHQLSDFMDIAQIESGRIKLDLAPTDYIPLLHERVGVQGALAQPKQITYELKADAGSACVNGDARRLRQALDNLLENAAKYSPKGSVIRVSTRVLDGKVFTEVADQGPGIPAELHDQLFTPFRTGAAKTTGGEKATGLGLAIVKAIVQEHAGAIWLESKPGEGARFTFTLPLVAS